MTTTTVNSVESIAALRALGTLTSSVEALWVQGYYAGADGGEGMFWYNSSSTSGDNGGTIIVDAAGRRWYRELEGRPVTAAQFGAKGDGVTDDYTVLVAMVNWLVEQGGGIALLQANKQYLLSSTLIVAGSDVEIWGSGRSTWIVNGTSGSAAIQFGNGTSTYYRCAIRDLAFGQASGVSASNGNCGLSCLKQSNMTVVSVSAWNFPAELYQGIVLNECDQCRIDRAEVSSLANTGIVFYSTGDMMVTNTTSDGNTEHGFYFDGSSGGKFVNCAAYGNSGSGWVLDNVNFSGDVQFHMTNCTGDTSGSHNWIIAGCTEAWFDCCWGSTQLSTTINPGAVGFHLLGNTCTNVTFSGGGAFFNNSAGVYLNNQEGGSPTNVYFMGFIAGTSVPAFGNGRGQTAPGFDISSGTAVTIVGGGATGNSGGAVDNAIGTQLNIVALNGYSF